MWGYVRYTYAVPYNKLVVTYETSADIRSKAKQRSRIRLHCKVIPRRIGNSKVARLDYTPRRYRKSDPRFTVSGRVSEALETLFHNTPASVAKTSATSNPDRNVRRAQTFYTSAQDAVWTVAIAPPFACHWHGASCQMCQCTQFGR